MTQRDAELLHPGFGLGRQQRRDFLERLGEVTVLVERVDQDDHEGAVALVEFGQAELRQEMVAQRGGVGRGEAAVAVLFVVGGAAPARRDVGRPVGFRGRRLGGRAAGGGWALQRGLGGRFVLAALDILALERRVLHEEAVDLLVELDRGELQQSDRLLELRRQREVLREAVLKRRLHAGIRRPRGGRRALPRGAPPELGERRKDCMRKFSPKYTRRTLSL